MIQLNTKIVCNRREDAPEYYYDLFEYQHYYLWVLVNLYADHSGICEFELSDHICANMPADHPVFDIATGSFLNNVDTFFIDIGP